MTGARSFPLALSLDYDHALGDLAEYFAALREKRALAGRCPACGSVRIPPLSRCPRDGVATQPIELSGSGRVAAATHTTARLPFTDALEPQTYVLVAMKGADNLMFGRMSSADEAIGAETPVRLAGLSEIPNHPAIAAVFEPDESS